MEIPNITWRGGAIDDFEILHALPPVLARLLGHTNGFILHQGALHVRGACLAPDWHSLREVWRGASALHELYDSVEAGDIPFAQDQVGDQFLIRGDAVLLLSAEEDKVETLSDSLDDFFRRMNEDLAEFLNVGLGHAMAPGQLLLAYPPFIIEGASGQISLKPVSALEVISFHADLARRIRNTPNGGKISFKIINL